MKHHAGVLPTYKSDLKLKQNKRNNFLWSFAYKNSVTQNNSDIQRIFSVNCIHFNRAAICIEPDIYVVIQ